MRSKTSLINAFVSMTTYIISILLGFISQKIFIQYLGNEYLGLNSLFVNIISVLAIVELGFGSAIIYNLYKPLSENNIEIINSLIQYYKKIYRIIAVVVLSLGVCLMPFLDTIVGKLTISRSIYFIFLLFLVDAVASYLLTYKRSIFYADQKTYIINIVHIGYLILLNASQVAVIILYKNYILYLVIKIIFRILENVIITLLANMEYPYLKTNNINQLDTSIKEEITKKVKGLLFHKIGSAVVFGTDNIIISMTKSLGVITVGLYSNYNMIIIAVSSLFSQTFSSVTATVGNLLIENNSTKTYKVYKNILLLNSWIYAFISASILCMIEPFIILWLGKDFLLSKFVLIVLVINLYIQGMRQTSNIFKNAAGIFYEDRYVPIFESILNIVFSILFAKFFGLAGIFIGTIVSSLLVYFYSYPKFVYGYVLKKNYVQYAKDYSKYIIGTFVSILPVFIITEMFKAYNQWIQLLINGVCCLIIPNFIYYLFFRKTTEYQYWKRIILSILTKAKKHIRIS